MLSIVINITFDGEPVKAHFHQRKRPVIELVRKYREAELARRRELGLPLPKKVTTYSSYGAFYSLIKKLAQTAQK